MRRVNFAKEPQNENFNSNAFYGQSNNPDRPSFAGTLPSKQRKIYEMWPGGDPNKVPFTMNTKSPRKGIKKAPAVNHYAEPPKNELQDNMGSSGSISFQPPNHPSNVNMYPHPGMRHPCPTIFNPSYWWPQTHGENTTFPPHFQMPPDTYGYSEPPNMFQNYPPPQQYGANQYSTISQAPMYGYNQPSQPRPSCIKNKIQPIPKPQYHASQQQNPELQGGEAHISNERPGTSATKKADATPTKDKAEKYKPKKIFVSTNARGLQAWSEVKQDTMVVFEIIGILNSQVTSEGVKYCKSFLIKDGQGHVINCEFYETDRQLCRTCRGKMYRCVGDFNVRRGIFHAVCVREADEKDVRLYRKLVAVANATLKNFKENYNAKN